MTNNLGFKRRNLKRAEVADCRIVDGRKSEAKFGMDGSGSTLLV